MYACGMCDGVRAKPSGFSLNFLCVTATNDVYSFTKRW